jgi:glycosyltransferase involved in cell wall biosynthesis
VIPCRNEEGNIEALSKEIDTVFAKAKFKWEVIWSDDGSTDNSSHIYSKLSKVNKVVSSPICRGQSSAIQTGILRAQFNFIGLIDGDGQNDPRDLRNMYEMAIEDCRLDFLQGKRKVRRDKALTRKIPSKLANFLIRKILRLPFRDLGCGTKLFKRIVAKEIPFSGEIHRLYAAHAYLLGFKVVEIEVNHRPRMHGFSKYGLDRVAKFLLDLLLVRLRFLVVRNAYYFLGFTALTIILGGLFLWLVALILRLSEVKDYFDGSLVVGGLVSILFGFGMLMMSTFVEIHVRKFENR